MRFCKGGAKGGFRRGLFVSLFLLLNLFRPLYCNSAQDSPEEMVPAPLLFLGTGGEVLVVEKGAQSLYIFDHNYRLLRTFKVTTGQKKGDKEREGDLKTPEGVYFFTEVIDPATLPAKYGVMAVAMDYPNPLDRLMKKGGSGIWLHATDEPERIDLPRDTRGCVVATNEDVLAIAGHINLLKTPIVIVERLDYISEKTMERERREVLEFLRRWKEGLTGEEASVAGCCRGSRIDLENAKILRHGDTVTVSFEEEAKDRRGSWVPGVGRLYLRKEAGSYKVAARRWTPLSADRTIARAFDSSR